MTDEEIDELTLGEVRRIAARAIEAAEDFKRMRAVFEPATVTVHAGPTTAGSVGAFVPAPNNPLAPPDNLTPAQRAHLEEARVLRQLSAQPLPPPVPVEDAFPPDIAAAMKAEQ